MNKNLDRRIHPIAEADGLSPKKLVKTNVNVELKNTTMEIIKKGSKGEAVKNLQKALGVTAEGV